jgi:hypothetical protein
MEIRNKVVHQGFEPTEQTLMELFNFISFFNRSKRLKQFTADAILEREKG